MIPSATQLFALLLYLALERGRAISRAELGAVLFAEEHPPTAAHNLRQLLYRVRRMGIPMESESLSVSLPEQVVEDGIAHALSATPGATPSTPEQLRAVAALLASDSPLQPLA